MIEIMIPLFLVGLVLFIFMGGLETITNKNIIVLSIILIGILIIFYIDLKGA
jgi:hypothetical protein